MSSRPPTRDQASAVTRAGPGDPEPAWANLDERGRRRRAWQRSPFERLARTHALLVAGDALVAIALADSLFFSLSPDDSRSRVLLYLMLTMLPFAVVAPLIGPAIDRAAGGRRWMVIGSAAGRGLMCLLLVRDIDSLLLFPWAFVLLVLSKGYSVAKSALVPTAVNTDAELVQANSKLVLISGLVGFLVGVPAFAISALGGPKVLMALGVGVFAVGTAAAFRLPTTVVAPLPPDEEERAELRGAGVLLAASAMAMLRGIVGFLMFLIAYSLRTEPSWQLGLAIAASVAGNLLGAAVAPPLRRRTREELILSGVLFAVVAGGAAAVYLDGAAAAAMMAAVVAIAASAGKQAFDAIVQRDAPDANRGRSFARFETRFQVVWVIGALIPVATPIFDNADVGYVCISGAAAFAVFSYLAGLRASRDYRMRASRYLDHRRRQIRATVDRRRPGRFRR